MASIRRFGELIETTPALRAYQQETTAGLVALAAGLLADRAGRDASDGRLVPGVPRNVPRPAT